VAARSKACVFSRSNTEVVGSNPTRSMDTYLLCVRVILAVGRGPSKG
jgi:hypothetical protein